jgi:hypothetical protein
LGEEYPAVIDANGFADHTGVVSDFQSLRNLAGHYMSPMTVPLTNNEALTETLKLAKGFLSERDERIFRELHRYMFRTIVPTSVAMRKQASSGAPFFNSSIELKKKSLALFNEKADDILARFAQGRLEELWLDYKLFFTTYMGVRTQPDAVTKEHGRYKAKEREVADEQYARSAGTLGRRFPADKRVYVDGMLIDDIFAMRRRSVYAYPAAYNYFLTQFFTPLRGFYLEDADFTFKHRSPAEIVEKLCIFESIRGYDVKQFDQSVQPWLLEKFVSEFSGFIREEVLFFFDKVLKQPIYQPHPSVVNAAGEDRPLTEFCPMLGDPFDLSSSPTEWAYRQA